MPGRGAWPRAGSALLVTGPLCGRGGGGRGAAGDGAPQVGGDERAGAQQGPSTP